MMESIENLKKLPLEDLIQYKTALDGLNSYYQGLVLPFYSKATEFDKITPYQHGLMIKMQRIKGYLSEVVTALEDKVFGMLDKCSEPVPEVTKEKKEKAKKTNGSVKKNSKKD